MTDFNHQQSESDDQDFISKSQIKKQLLDLQKLGKQLMELSSSDWQKLGLGDRLLQALEDSKKIRRNGARKRHKQFIGGLLRHEDSEEISQYLENLNQPNAEQTALLHKLETWRDRLLNEGAKALDEFLGTYPEVDCQYLRQLLRNAAKEQQLQKPPAAKRKLFRYLRELEDGR